MGTMNVSDADPERDLIRQAAGGDTDALWTLFSAHSDRLKRMLRLRLNRHLQGRIDSSDILQETYLEVARKLEAYLHNPEVPFFLWLRQLTGMKLAEVHRRHLDAQKRDAGRDVSIYRGALPAANSVSLAAQLLGQLTTPSEAAVKAERRLKLQEVLDAMDLVDREIIALRHFEQLTTEEAAVVLGLSKSGAGSRYIRALKRLKQTLRECPEFNEL